MRRPFPAALLCAAVAVPACSSSQSPPDFPSVGTGGPQGGGGGDDASSSGGTGSSSNSSSSSDASTGTSSSGAGLGSSGATSSSGSGGSGGGHDAAPADAHPSEASSSSGSGADGGLLDSARQACVARINYHRASIGLAALAPASASTDACSDLGAMQDATSGTAHSSAGMCPGTGGQDSCPDLPVGGVTGATLISSVTQCLDQMWAEGPPPAGTSVTQCIQDYTGCFLQHGHYINMSDSYMVHSIVSCGFYRMSNGDYWGNQNFGP